MAKVSTLANEQLNPVDGDLLEVSHETATGSGVWGSFKMKLSTLKAYILGYKLRSYTFSAHDVYIEVILARYEQLVNINVRTDGISLTVENSGLGTLYVDNETGDCFPINFYAKHATEVNRTIIITPSNDCVIKILSIENV